MNPIPIPVKSHPFRQTFDSFDDAIRHTLSHPLRSVAETHTQLLEGTTLVEACWSHGIFLLGFSNGLWLEVYVADSSVRWDIHSSQPILADEPQFRVGAPAICLDWQGTIGLDSMNPSELVVKRIGAEFDKLLINHTGFFVYFHRHLVLQFHAAFRMDTGADILYVIEDD